MITTNRILKSSTTGRRAAPGGFSSLLLLAITVQISLAMLEWAGPGSSDTRTRLATTMVAAAHQGVFTEPRRQAAVDLAVYLAPESRPAMVSSLRPLTPAPVRAAASEVPDWHRAIPPPAC